VQSVLIVEEDDAVRGLVNAIVKSAGYDPVEAMSGEHAFTIAQRGVVDVIILDCLGRSGKGMETLKRLRANAVTTAIPVIALCGLGQYGAELGLWAKAVVVKPFRPAQLLIKLQNAMRVHAPEAFTDNAQSLLRHAI
jgi:DNA-binding response OmpR family regulator